MCLCIHCDLHGEVDCVTHTQPLAGQPHTQPLPPAVLPHHSLPQGGIPCSRPHPRPHIRPFKLPLKRQSPLFW